MQLRHPRYPVPLLLKVLKHAAHWMPDCSNQGCLHVSCAHYYYSINWLLVGTNLSSLLTANHAALWTFFYIRCYDQQLLKADRARRVSPVTRGKWFWWCRSGIRAEWK
jgi:hypothetical protein